MAFDMAEFIKGPQKGAKKDCFFLGTSRVPKHTNLWSIALPPARVLRAVKQLPRHTEA
jgi:hypothetical protein